MYVHIEITNELHGIKNNHISFSFYAFAAVCSGMEGVIQAYVGNRVKIQIARELGISRKDDCWDRDMLVKNSEDRGYRRFLE